MIRFVSPTRQREGPTRDCHWALSLARRANKKVCMTIACPCCKASNATSLCRRCKADLSLLFQIEESRAFHINVAKRFAADERWLDAQKHLRTAEELQAGSDVAGLQAAVLLHLGEYSAALARLPAGEPQ